ncbi:30S ribosomal protein S5 [bacterium]|nr:30S ribosomal protein S5 [bacterium]|tara:strand:- start:624 stop:1265 length:642 start_codon:yes stop_codon:yes gene_type:complete
MQTNSSQPNRRNRPGQGGPGGSRGPGGPGGQGGRGGHGGQRGRGRREEGSEFDQKVIDIARVTRVMAGGKRMRFRACVIVGDTPTHKIGMGIAKGADVSIAVNKAASKAQKKMIEVPVIKGTLPHQIRQKFGAAIVLLKPAPTGTGIIAGGAVRSVLETAGVEDVVGKILGSKNKINNVHATISALGNLQTPTKKVNKDKIKKKTTKAENSKL